jgi:SAM-dependent methyltransferase
MTRGLSLAIVLAMFAAGTALAQPAATRGDATFEPQVGQAGKDVIWVPTPDQVVDVMLKAAKTTKDDLVYDLGAGDGKIAIAAAKNFGARAIGIEFNPDMAKLGQRNVERAGVADRVKIIQGDIFVEDFSKATVLTLYLLPDLNIKLRPQILKMKPGTRVVSHQFMMGDWQPDETYKVEFREAFLWIVPAQIGGIWTVKEDRGPLDITVSITQSYQKIGGIVTAPNKNDLLLGAYLDGANVGFSFHTVDGRLLSVKGAVIDNDTIKGEINWLGVNTPFTARRKAS